MQLSSEFGGRRSGGPVNQAAAGIVRAVGAGSVVSLTDDVRIENARVRTEEGGPIEVGTTAGSPFATFRNVMSDAEVKVVPQSLLMIKGTRDNHRRSRSKRPPAYHRQCSRSRGSVWEVGAGSTMRRAGVNIAVRAAIDQLERRSRFARAAEPIR